MSAGEAAAILERRAHGRVVRGGAIGPLTSYRLGGPAAVLLEAATEGDLAALSEAVRQTGMDVLVVGRGSNMLVSDRGFEGIVVRLTGAFRWARVERGDLAAGGAMPLPALASVAHEHALAGLEFAVAIPASLGGAVRMNAGAHGHEIGEVVRAAVVWLLPDGRPERIEAPDAGFGYRASAFPPASIVTGAILGLSPGDPEVIATGMREAREWRRATQPLNLPNGGSVFKNPPGGAAGRLIEEVGAKGLRIGGAQVSEVHANFIVAGEGARADEVYTLVRRIQRLVRERTGIDLEPELRLVGEFEEVVDGSG